MMASPDQLLFHYRAKDSVEKLFALIKVEMEGDRMRTHNESTTNGKTFVTFIAGIIRTSILVQMSQYLNANSTSLKKSFYPIGKHRTQDDGLKKNHKKCTHKKAKRDSGVIRP